MNIIFTPEYTTSKILSYIGIYAGWVTIFVGLLSVIAAALAASRTDEIVFTIFGVYISLWAIPIGASLIVSCEVVLAILSNANTNREILHRMTNIERQEPSISNTPFQ